VGVKGRNFRINKERGLTRRKQKIERSEAS